MPPPPPLLLLLLVLLLTSALLSPAAGAVDKGTCSLLCNNCEASRLMFSYECPGTSCPCLQASLAAGKREITAASTSGPTASTSGPTASTSGPTASTSEPTASASEPTASASEPTASTSEPTASTYEPTASTYEPTASTYEPTASTYEPTASTYEPTASTPQCPAAPWLDKLYCPYGFVQDSSGCASRECAQPPGCASASEWSRACGQRAACPQGYRLNASGCATCDCLGCPLPELPADCQPDSSLSCSATLPDGCLVNCSCSQAPGGCGQQPQCSNDCGPLGYETDANGCRQSCRCRCQPPACAGNATCVGGYDTDRFGCRFCTRCGDSGGGHQQNPWWCFDQAPNCTNRCVGGYYRTEDDCQFDCSCRCQQLPAACPADCRWGVAKDAVGCDACNCVRLREHQEAAGCSQSKLLLDTCRTFCRWRHGNEWLQLDEAGCHVCSCCPNSNCQHLSCPYGELLLDSSGCPTCQCKYSREVDYYFVD